MAAIQQNNASGEYYADLVDTSQYIATKVESEVTSIDFSVGRIEGKSLDEPVACSPAEIGALVAVLPILAAHKLSSPAH